jgi:hemolysin activation/secretion protein
MAAAAGTLATMQLALASETQAAPQAPPTITREQLNPAARARAPRPRDVFEGPAYEPCELPDDSKFAFVLKGVNVSGSKALDEPQVRRLYADLLGREITPRTVCEIRDRATLSLFRRGILARVVIPEQRIAGGEVALTVIEAQIVRVRYKGDIGPAQARVEGYLNKLNGLAPFDLDTAQRYLLLANDIPGVRASASLTHSKIPGAPAGGIDMDVTLSRVPVDAVAAVQNTNSKTLGPWSAIGRVDINSLTGFGERTSLIGYSTLGQNAQEVVQLIEQGRIGEHGLFAQGSFSYGRSHPGDVLKPLDLRADSYVGTIELDDPLLRLRRKNLTLAGGFDWIDQKTKFSNTGSLITDDKLREFWLRATAQGAHVFSRPVIGGAFSTDADLTLEARKGGRILGASEPGALALSRPEGRPDPWIMRADGQVSAHYAPQGFGLPLSATLHTQDQWADRPLLAFDEQAIGNLTIGRGYDPAAASGDRVVAAEGRMETGLRLARRLELSPYGFYDFSRVWNLDQGSQTLNLRSIGAGVGLRFGLGRYNFRGDVAYARPLDKPVPSAAKKPPARVLFQLIIAG